jgi:DNA-binding CsgD family transcriptional regulator
MQDMSQTQLFNGRALKIISQPKRRFFSSGKFIVAILVFQSLCAIFFVGNILHGVFDLGFGQISWRFYEFIELGAATGLFLGVITSALALRRNSLRTADAESRLRSATGDFMKVVQEHFEGWALTPAECDVALFTIKGLSTAEIAALRETSKGTVKAQTNAVYRKAGVNGRPQLLSIFIDELMDGVAIKTPS